MTYFNIYEKKLIKDIIRLESEKKANNLENLFDPLGEKPYLPKSCYIQIDSPENIYLQIDNDLINNSGIEAIRELEFQINRQILTIVSLLEYLEKNRLAFFIGDLDTKMLGNNSKGSGNEYTPSLNFIEKENKILLYKYARKRIFVSESLIVLVRDNFLSKEELRHREIQKSTYKQLKYTLRALWVTVIGLLFSIFSHYFNIGKTEIMNKPLGVTLNDSSQVISKIQLNKIIESIEDNTSCNIDLKNKTVEEFDKFISLIELQQNKNQALLSKDLDHIIKILSDMNNKMQSTEQKRDTK